MIPIDRITWVKLVSLSMVLLFSIHMIVIAVMLVFTNSGTLFLSFIFSTNQNREKNAKSALDMCYAHPNGDRGSRYHYHVWSPCLSTCTGESELIGIALDGFPIYGPGINPDTGKVWSQSDMDLCGGRQDKNGKYAYYTTVDFPYMLQCYRGHTDETENLVNGKSFKILFGS